MKILKSIFILILFFIFITSCTIDDIVEESETNATENIQANGDDEENVDETEKG
jgi:hypothetical protein